MSQTSRALLDGVPSRNLRQMNDPSHPGFWRLVAEDLRTQEGQWSRPGFHAMCVYRLGSQRHRHALLLRKVLGLLYHLLHRLVRNFYGIELHATAQIGRRVKIAHQGAIVIHENASIGDDCVIRQGVTIGAVADRSASVAPRLGRSVMIGAGAVIIGRVTVGDDVQIGPNAVVTMNVPAGSTVAAPMSRVITP